MSEHGLRIGRPLRVLPDEIFGIILFSFFSVLVFYLVLALCVYCLIIACMPIF